MSDHISGRTNIIGVIGDPIEHTRSPAMHNAAFRALGLDCVYVPFHVRDGDAAKALEGMRALNLRGLNVTVPHKQAIAAAVDRLTPAASAVGAVNTVLWDGDALVGDNTDIDGIRRAVGNLLGQDDWPDHAVVFGAGGAARGVVYALTTTPGTKSVTVLNRTVSRAQALADEFDGDVNVVAGPLEKDVVLNALKDAGLAINVSNLGRGELADRSPIPDDWSAIHGGLVVVDSNYDPPETKLMRQVRQAGGRAVNGCDMLVYQGAKSFELWTGKTPDIEVMRQASGIAD
ncbi:MAG: shikimate dehydrogenase [Candidatus Latescibacteria bacterium]|nr:shikimate dehydrogenase [Candidatus Latescibacterota bacterium]